MRKGQEKYQGTEDVAGVGIRVRVEMERPWLEVVAGTGAGIVSVKTQGTAPAAGTRRKTEGPRLFGVETVFVLVEARTWGTRDEAI